MDENKSMYEIGKDIQCLQDTMIVQNSLNDDNLRFRKETTLSFIFAGMLFGWMFAEIRKLNKKLSEKDKETKEEG